MLDSIEKLVKILSTIAIPVVLLVVGNWYSASQKDKDLGQKYVEIAIRILSEEPTDDNQQLRKWAVETVNRYAEIKIDDDLKSILVEKEAIPVDIVDAPQRGFREFVGERLVKRIIVSDSQGEDMDRELAALKQLGVSYHYLVGLDGEILRLVDENDVAFHAGRNNGDSIGVGLLHVGGKAYPDAQVEALRTLIGEIASRHGLKRRDVVSRQQVDPRKASDFGTIADRVLAGL
ncbi:MAG: peptidoglycan recognition family protein [Rhizobiaceae bacterium]